jgi:hypothetical protein
MGFASSLRDPYALLRMVGVLGVREATVEESPILPVCELEALDVLEAIISDSKTLSLLVRVALDSNILGRATL